MNTKMTLLGIKSFQKHGFNVRVQKHKWLVSTRLILSKENCEFSLQNLTGATIKPGAQLVLDIGLFKFKLYLSW